MKFFKKWFVLILLIFAASLSGQQKVYAHKVIVFAWVEDGMVHTESSFGGRKKAQNSKISVFNDSNKLILDGITDVNGDFAFKIPQNVKSDLIIRLDASTGHQAEWRLDKKELVQQATLNDISNAMEKKDKLEASPSMYRIIGGILIIFGLAFVAKLFLKKK